MVNTPSRGTPFVLLQPGVDLQNLFHNFDLVGAAKQERLPNLEAAYIGLVEETGSLFAMSPDRYPLVVFGDTNLVGESVRGRRRTIGAPPGSIFDTDRDFPADLDSIHREMKRKKLKKLCENGSKDMRCLTGVRRLESSRLSRLLDGPASVPFPPQMSDIRNPSAQGHPNHSGASSGDGNASLSRPPGLVGHHPDSSRTYTSLPGQVLATYAVGIITLVIMFIWVFQRKVEKRSQSDSPTSPVTADVAVPLEETPKSESPAPESVASTDGSLVDSPAAEPKIPAAEVETRKAKPRTVSFGDVIKASGVLTDAEGEDGGENGGEGDDSDGEAAPAPGKRKPIRRKRGRKKKGGAGSGSAEDGSEESKDPKQGEGARDPAEEPQTPKANGLSEPVHVVSPSSTVELPPSTPVPVMPSLKVTENILGMSCMA